MKREPIDSRRLLKELAALNAKAIAAAGIFCALPEEQLQYQAAPGKWSILECIEHLNRYGNFYLPALERKIRNHQEPNPPATYRPGLLGHYFAGLMQTSGSKGKGMKAPNNMNPAGAALTPAVLHVFLEQCTRLERILEAAARADLGRVKVPISLTRLVKLKLGDTLRFFVYHIERHVKQAGQAAGKAQATATAEPAQAF